MAPIEHSSGSLARVEQALQQATAMRKQPDWTGIEGLVIMTQALLSPSTP
jgi:hypothetical protein